MRRRVRGFLTVLAAIVAVFLTAETASATGDHYGNNQWTPYRLPWQHSLRFGLTQGYNTCGLGENPTHCGFSGYALDFAMPYRTPVLAITGGTACLDSGSGLGNYVVQRAPPAGGRSGEDYYFYGHIDTTWVQPCWMGWDPVSQGQIVAWSGDTGAEGAFHLHTPLMNPGYICYCGPYTIAFPALSGIDFNPYAGTNICNGCSPVDWFISDSVMPGDDNVVGAGNEVHWNQDVFDDWSRNGGLNEVGSPKDNGSGPGVHGWGPGLVQDFAGGPWQGDGIIMQSGGSGTAYWVHGAIFWGYINWAGAWENIGYPINDEYDWNGWRRSDFVGGAQGGGWICWVWWLWWLGPQVHYGYPVGESC